MRRNLALFLVGACFATAGCASSQPAEDQTVTGVISEVSGDLTVVTGFVVLSDDATSYQFTPEPELMFMGGPLTHLRDHVISGDRVVVSFETGDGGTLVATGIVHE